MNKIVLSALAALTLGTVSATAGEITQETEKSFFDRFHAKGDMRLRYETIEKTYQDDSESNKYRTRYRFRYTLNVDIMDNLLLETGISSGRYNPTSGNVTFDTTDKDGNHKGDNWADYFVDVLKVDIADLKYSFGDSWIRAGKSKHHIYRPIKTQLIWDNDIRLEGVNYGFKNDSSNIRVGVNRVHRESGKDRSYKDGDDINIFLAQYVHKQKMGDAKLNLGAGYYFYDGVKGNTIQSDNGFKQNSKETVNGVDVYAEDYGILEAFGEVKYDVMGLPLKGAVTLAYNTLADKENFGYDLSVQYGATKKVGDWKLAATYRDIDKDAVYGAHNDSDFSGGGTDSNGYYVKGKYKFAKNVDLGAWLNWSTLKPGVEDIDYHRVQLDAILKF